MKNVNVAMLMASVLLTACGGGGGDTPLVSASQPAKPQAATGSMIASATKVFAPVGVGTAEVTLTVTTANASSASLTDSKGKVTPVQVNQTVSIKVSPSLGEEMYTLDYGGSEKLTVKVMVSCVEGAFVSGGICATKITYDPLVYVKFDVSKYPARIKGETCANIVLEEAKNNTRFQSGFYPHWATYMRAEPLPSGRVLVSSLMTQDESNRHTIVLDPATNTLSDYNNEEGVPPPITDAGWIGLSGLNPDPNIGRSAETPGYLIFALRSGDGALYCRDKVTGETRNLGVFGAVTILLAYGSK